MKEEYAYKKLIVWQKSDILAKEIYKITFSFPKEEIYGITSQIRRSALSVPLNIIEGYARNNKKEFKNFLRIAYASLAETEYLLDFAFFQNYMSKQQFIFVKTLLEECEKVLWSFLRSQS